MDGKECDLKQPGMSRRALLRVGSLAILGAPVFNSLYDPLSAHALSPESVGASVDIGRVLTTICFSTDASQRFEVDVPRTLDFGENSPGDVTITWDPRVHDVSGEGVVSFSGGRPNVVLSATDSADGTATFSVPAGANRLLLNPRPLLNYPADLVADPVASAVTADGRTLACPVRSQAAAVWGAELYVSWVAYKDHFLPTLIEVRSVGPSPTPDGMEVELRLPVAAIVELSARSAVSPDTTEEDSAKPSAKFAVPTLSSGQTWQASAALPDDAADVGRPQPSLNAMSTATLIFSDGAARDARETGRYSSVPVTDSGSQISSFIAAEKA